jgi:rare lipoprotein A
MLHRNKQTSTKLYRRAALPSLLMLLSACSVMPQRDGGPAPGSIDVSSIPNAVPKVEPRSKYGNPSSYVVNGRRYHVMKSSKGYVERGIASWYGKKFQGHRTSSGETYNMYAMTAAHKKLPLPSYVQVTNLRNGRNVIVRVNDRGPFQENRLIDLSYTAAAKLGIIKTGTGLVEVRAIDPRTYNGKWRSIQVRAGKKSGGDKNPDFYIQVGAFSKLINAQNLRVKLASLTHGMVHISKADVNGARVYRVRIGPLSDVDVADHIVTELDRLGMLDHHIVVD